MKMVPVILAGGIGERFWPISRSSFPKQLLTLFGNGPMIQQTFRRMKRLAGSSCRPLIVTSKEIAPKIKAVLASESDYDLIVEVAGKNTAPAIAIAAFWIREHYGNSFMAIDTADHIISPVKGYCLDMRLAKQVALHYNSLVTFGISPGYPETGYGYIQKGKSIECFDIKGRCFEVKRFVEKPNASTANRYVKSKSYLWNSGIFLWTTDVIIEEFKKYMPTLYLQAEMVAKNGFTDNAIDSFFLNCQKESIDYGILEKSQRVTVVQASFCWDDVGTWEAIARLYKSNQLKTVVVGKNIDAADSSNSIIVNQSNSSVAVWGVKDMVIILTNDAVLLIPRYLLANLKNYLSRAKQNKILPPELF